MEKHKQPKYASRYPLQHGQGIRCTWRVQPGEIVDVRTRSGKIYQTRVTTILWEDANDGSLICRTRGCKQRPSPWAAVALDLSPDEHDDFVTVLTEHDGRLLGMYRHQSGTVAVSILIDKTLYAVARGDVPRMIRAMCAELGPDESDKFDHIHDPELHALVCKEHL